MCANHSTQPRILDQSFYFYLCAVGLGLITGFLNLAPLNSIATIISDLFINLLKLVSLPIIFLSIISTASSMKNVHEIKFLGLKVVRLTLLTTVLAATIALAMFWVWDPVNSHLTSHLEAVPKETQGSYWNHLIQAVPSNIIQPFASNNVIGVLFIAMALSLSILSLPEKNRETLHGVFSSLYAAIMKMTLFIVRLMPVAVWAFVALFVKDIQNGMELQSLAYYLGAVIAANLIQGFIVLPLLLKAKGVSPLQLFKAMSPALSVAFFTKSSSATLPMAMGCAQERAGVSSKISSFALPLCTTINMNGCAAFILITVLFVSMSHGVQFSNFEMISWIFISTIAAVGNAGVPMGCYFLASAFLAAMNVPLHIMGVILPFYTLIDMVETALNVWSDSCVTAIVQKEVDQTAALIPESIRV